MIQTLLVAEGDAELRDLYGAFLRKQGYQVETASDGLACLEKLRRLEPVALVLDLELLWGGGTGVLEWMRTEGAMVEVPVVATATAGHRDGPVLCNGPPVVEYLHKPFPLPALLKSVRAAVARQEAREASHLHSEPACSELFIG